MTEDLAKNIVNFMTMCEQESMESFRSFAEEHGIKDIDEDILIELGNVRRPLVLFRGKPITTDQVIQLVAGEEPLFGEGGKEGCQFDPRSWSGVLNHIFYRQGYFWLDTWVHCDGTIGGNNTALGKYPEWVELYPQYMHLAKKYPFLDMVISYTMCNESTCYWCERFSEDCFVNKISDCKCKDCEQYLDRILHFRDISYDAPCTSFTELYFGDWDSKHVRSDVGDSVATTIWIHNGKTDILFGDKAAAKFNEYNGLYSAPEYDFMFTSSLHRYKDTCICTKSFVEDCFESIGKPRSLCDEYVERGFISPFNEDAIVVTKEWVIEQYNTYIAGK